MSEQSSTQDQSQAETTTGTKMPRGNFLRFRSSSVYKQDEKFVTESFSVRLRNRLDAEIDTNWADIILIGCFFCVGLVDSMAFNIYGCFVGMQTGNTVFLGLGSAGIPEAQPRYSWVKSLMAMIGFVLGALFFSRYHRLLGPLKRWVVMSSFLIQTLMITLIAGLVTGGVLQNRSTTSHIISKDDSGITETISRHFPWADLAAVAILAFQTAGQIVASRVLKFNSMPTVVVTSLLCDLMSDPRLFTAALKENAERNRRVAGVICLFLGAVSGGFLSKSWAGFAGGLWIAAMLKFMMTCAWFLWRPKYT